MTNPRTSRPAPRKPAGKHSPPASAGRAEAADPVARNLAGHDNHDDSPANGGPVGCSNLKLRRLTRLMSRHYDAHLARCGLKTTQYSLLAVIADRGPLRLGELARLLSLDASTLTRNLRPLVEAGLVVNEAGRDARSRQVSPTAAGRDLRVQARQHWKQAQHAFNAAIGAQRVAALHELVDDCYRTLAAAGGGERD